MRLLRQAAALGDFLVVGLNSDASVRRLKGPSRPLNPRGRPSRGAGGPGGVDAVTVFDEETPLELIEAILPDVLVKGGDYRPEEVVGRDEVEAAGGRLVLIPLVEGHSTTGLVHRVAERTGDGPSPRARAAGPRHQAGGAQVVEWVQHADSGGRADSYKDAKPAKKDKSLCWMNRGLCTLILYAFARNSLQIDRRRSPFPRRISSRDRQSPSSRTARRTDQY